MYYQQGDVLLFAEDINLDSMVKVKSNILAEGEATGHAHRLETDSEFDLMENPKTKERHLKLVKPTKLYHEEHKPIEIPPGTYRIGIVKEFDHFENEARRVAD